MLVFVRRFMPGIVVQTGLEQGRRAALPPCGIGMTMIIIVVSFTERVPVTMRTRSFADMSCSIAGALELVGDRWTLLIVRDLLFGLSRFDDLQKSTGIPPQTLADRLRRLEASKVITKHRAPATKGYGLTEMGRDLLTVVTALREWGDRWQLHGTVGPPVEVFDAHSGSPVQLAMVASETGQRVRRNQLVRKPGPGADELMRFRLRGGQPELVTKKASIHEDG
jgi:DNA-binding HxlR family transcriptional regulator